MEQDRSSIVDFLGTQLYEYVWRQGESNPQRQNAESGLGTNPAPRVFICNVRREADLNLMPRESIRRF